MFVADGLWVKQVAVHRLRRKRFAKSVSVPKLSAQNGLGTRLFVADSFVPEQLAVHRFSPKLLATNRFATELFGTNSLGPKLSAQNGLAP